MFPSVKEPFYLNSIEFPSDVTKLTSSDISKLHARFINMQCFAKSECSKLSRLIVLKESELDASKSLLWTQNSPQIEQKWKLDQSIKSDPKMMHLRTELEAFKADKELIFTNAEIYERFAYALSRELSRRSSELQHTL